MYNANEKKYKWLYKGISLLLAVAMVALCMPISTQAAEKKKVVKVGYYIAPGFQDYNEDAREYSGSSYEYMMALKQYTNWEFQFIPVEFSDGVEMLENGELDLMNNISKTPEREELLNFSTYASGSNYGCLIVNVDNTEYAYGDYESFSTMKVGLMTKSIFSSYFEDYCSGYNISPTVVYYDTDEKLQNAMNSGEIDARIVSSSYQDGSRVVAKFAPMDYYFATPKADTELAAELNTAMEQIRTDLPGLEQELQNRYNTKYIENTVVLSQAEKDYIAKHPVVTVAVSEAWYPLSYFKEDGTYTGPIAEIYDRISKVTGITFEYIGYADYDAALMAFQTGQTDMICEFPYDFVFADQWNAELSNLISEVNVYRVTNENTYTGKVKKVAIFGNTYLDEQVKKMYGDDVTYITYPDATTAVDSVLKGETDCIHLNYYQATGFQNRGKYLVLKYVLEPSLQYNFGLGISANADDELKTLIAKGLQTIDADDIEAMLQDTVQESGKGDFLTVFYQHPTAIIISISIFAAIVVLIIFFVIYSRNMKKKNMELERAKKAQSDFLSRMSHDMRTPMNGIMGLTSLMLDKHNLDEIHKDLDQLRFSEQYLLNLINDTLDMNKIESGKLELHPTPINGEQLMENILVNAHIMAEDKGIDLQVSIPPIPKGAWKNVVVDASRLEQILMNLISNAIKYTARGGKVDLIMDAVETTDEEVVDRYIIRDSGIGMTDEYLPHLFEPFSMEGRANTERQNGTGLGMSIVSQLVKLMDGDITVKSKVDVGTEVTLIMRYPIYDGVIETEKEEVSLEKLEGKRILMCEDHPLNAQIMERLLSKVGIESELATTGQEGVDKFQASEVGYYDLILMDIRMPIMDGIEATQTIRLIEGTYAKDIPIIAMTANAFDDDVENCLNAGMNAHLSKPIDPDKLYTTIAKFIK